MEVYLEATTARWWVAIQRKFCLASTAHIQPRAPTKLIAHLNLAAGYIDYVLGSHLIPQKNSSRRLYYAREEFLISCVNLELSVQCFAAGALTIQSNEPNQEQQRPQT